MLAESLEVRSLDDLRNYVQETICFQNELEPNAFVMTERILLRNGKPCGIYYCLHGPRSVKFVAIWENERNSILFYGATGERLGRARLTRALALTAAA